MDKIRIDGQGHIYINEHDISSVVADFTIDGELLVLWLVGDITLPEEPKPKPKPKPKRKTKAVKDE